MDTNITMLYDTLGILENGAYDRDGHTVPLKLKRAAMLRSDVFLPDRIDKLRRAAAEEPLHGPLCVRLLQPGLLLPGA